MDYDSIEDVNDKWLKIKQDTQTKFGFDFFPTRHSFIEFLRKFAVTDPEAYDRLFNIFYRSDELHRHLNEAELDVVNTRFKGSMTESDAKEDQQKNKCGHIFNYACYIDSNKCCICDRNSIIEMARD